MVTKGLPPMSLAFENVTFKVMAPAAKEGEGRGACSRSPIVEKTLLHSVTGYVEPGQCMAIMGASGAGKSTLLDILAGRHKGGTGSGTIHLGCDPSVKDPQRHVAYVMQDDALIGTLTVRETLLYAARLKLPRDKADSEAEQVVRDILRILNLTKVGDSLIGSEGRRGISGGERRRVSIGSQLVTDPSLLFLDEPTSGLDATNALRVVRAITRLCREGRTVVCTIHQPRSNVFFMFDQLLLLLEGHAVYMGATSRVMEYMAARGYVCQANVNPADYLLDILDIEEEEPLRASTVQHLSRQSQSAAPENERSPLRATPKRYDGTDAKDADGDEDDDDDEEEGDDRRGPRDLETGRDPRALIGAYEASEQWAHTSATASALHREPGSTRVLSAGIGKQPDEYATSFWRQLGLLWRRTLQATVRDPGVMYVRTGAALVIGLLVGALFWQLPDERDAVGDRMNVILFIVCVFSLFCLPALSGFIEDRTLVQREQGSGFYRTSAYFLGNFFVEFPILLMVVLLYGVVCYWMVGFHPEAENFVIFLVILALMVNTNFACAQAIGAYARTVTMAGAAYMIVLVYCLLLGGFIVSKSNLPEGLQWALYTSYYYYGYEALSINEFGDKAYGKDVLDGLGFEADNLYLDIGILFGIFIALRLVAYMLLRFGNRPR